MPSREHFKPPVLHTVAKESPSSHESPASSSADIRHPHSTIVPVILARFWSLQMTLTRRALLLLILSLTSILAIAQAPAPSPARPNVRAITGFVRIDRANYQKQVADTVAVLVQAKTAFEKEGYQVQTVRVTTQPFPEYVRGLDRAQALAFLK